ncbi:MAG: tRNA glutamyl-Q(34) synthetase GluQRS [Gammaproteobacteria bacterium]|nr:tRNA glutamyl-Q(34) synthetase GluQRS [Gammaproteobacteria bacterium]MBI5614735.1 tRNA glutamyl-Q(34) synthetase GluQRS [Gammaproteobacteria bacterium]
MSGYCGRFAPSPSGPLHFGSVVAALGSWLAARAAAGRWLVRMEDIDPPREKPGAAAAILRTLEALGLAWDGPILYQSTRIEAYRAALARLRTDGHTFHCRCSRKNIGESPYPGTCRTLGLTAGPRTAVRVRVPDETIVLEDALQGRYAQALASAVGDFVIWRADDQPAYHLAVVVDDAWQDVTDIVRGSDLLSSTPRQILLQRLLGLPHPNYLHLPLALDHDGAKLSKQTLAAPVDGIPPAATLVAALGFLGQEPPRELARATVSEVLARALAHWTPARVPRASRIVGPID